jgi:hypothetical protein
VATNKAKTIVVRPNGLIEFIYDDDLKGFIDQQSEKKLFRASHVEPDDKGNWWADLSPIDGPKLGPFNTRQAALNAEVEWIQKNYLGARNENSNSAEEQGTV